jgi:hypothetical protein
MNDEQYHYEPHQHHEHDNPESLRLEIVTTCVGFDDILDVTLTANHKQSDHYIVVTTHADRLTQKVAKKHSVTCVLSDLFFKNGRKFNKGAAINAGFDYFQYYGWRLHLDSDIMLPDNFRRVLFNHTHLERHCLYGCDRLNIVGSDNINKLIHAGNQQHHHGLLLGETEADGELGHRLVDSLRGYLPLGFFQLWNYKTQKPYPYSLGTAAHDDMMFSALWTTQSRRHLPSVICYHLCPETPKVSQNWEGRKSARLVLPH